MSVVKRVRSRTRQLTGRAKQMFGRATGDQSLRTRGKADRMVGMVRETGNEVRDWAVTAARDARRRMASHRQVT